LCSPPIAAWWRTGPTGSIPREESFPMRSALAALLLATALPATGIAAPVPAYVEKAVAAPMRDADKKDDERRKGAEITAFAGIKPGQTVVDLLPGAGYWTKIFAGVVGPKGKIYDVWTDAYPAAGSKGETVMTTLLATPGLTVEKVRVPLASFALPAPADVVFTSQNLHDFPNPSFGKLDITAVARQIYASLKPGGRFIVIDHAGAAGTGATQTDTLHRIEPAYTRKAIEAAGFKFAGESKLLAHAADDHTLKVFDPSLRGFTDQFVFAFVKPKK
jgi:predicted methyltransferase